MKIHANRSHRWAVGSTLIALLAVLTTVQGAEPTTVAVQTQPQVSCEDVRLRCSFDSGCNAAMKHYFLVCDKLLDANTEKCPVPCLYALAALTTTRHGHLMLDCTCRDSYCEMMKSRVEVCRPQVIALTQNESVVPPCDFARLVCQVDPECLAAYNYHVAYCRRSMHQNMPCSPRCLNSWQILERQEKAKTMTRCRCAGEEALECLLHKERMLRLCYNEGRGFPAVAAAAAAADEDDDDDYDKADVRPSNERKKLWAFETDPDRRDVELMLADPNYIPDLQSRLDVLGDGTGSASAVRRSWSAAVLCAAAAAALLVTRRG